MNYPEYTDDMSPEEKIALCIEFEVEHGGNFLAAAKAILRDIKFGHIKIDEKQQQEVDYGQMRVVSKENQAGPRM